MAKKEKSLQKIVKQAEAKAKAKKLAEERNKAGAIIRDLDKPQGQYTKEIICVDCGKPRKVKPQDAWQVKRCVECQDKRRGAGLKNLVERKSNPSIQREEKAKAKISKLDEWVKENDEDCAKFALYRKRIEKEAAEEPKPKLRWPK